MAGSTLMSILVKLGLDSSDFEKGINGAEGKATGLGAALANIGKGIATAGIAAAGAAIAGTTAFLVDATKAAMEAEDIQAQLNAVLTSTGGIAGVTADQVNDMATAMSKVTKFEDDAIVSGENMLLTFTNIGKDVFPATTQTMLDMSQAMGQDLKSSAIMLGKALNDPTEGISALTRVGVTFTDEQKNLIASLQATGDMAGAQNIILAELQREFGGAAEAAGSTAAGKIEIFKNSLGNLKEEIGGAFLPILAQAADKLTAFINTPEMQARVQEVIAGIQNIIGGLTNLAEKLLSGEMPAGVEAMLGPIVTAFTETMPMIQEKFTAMWEFLKTTVATLAPQVTESIQGFLDGIAIFWTNNGALIMSILQTTWNVVVTVIGVAISIVSGILSATMALINGDWATAWAVVQSTIENVLNIILGLVGTNLDEFKAVWTNNFEMLKTIVSTGLENARTTISNAVGNFIEAGANLIQGLIDGVKSKIGELLGIIADMAAEVTDKVRGLFREHSPSLVFMDIGKNLMAGLAKGITKAAALPQIELDKAVNGLTTGVQQSIEFTATGPGVSAPGQYGNGETPPPPQQPTVINIYANSWSREEVVRLAQQVAGVIQQRG